MATWLLLGAGALAAAEAPAGLQITEQVEFYHLDATDMEGLRRQLTERGPARTGRASDALAEVSLQARYRLQPFDGGCRLHRVRVIAHIVVTLPHWDNRPRAGARLARRWDRMIDGLSRHEEGHRHHARQHAGRLFDQLTAIPAHDDCSSLRLRAESLVQRAMIRLQLAGAAYDFRTAHGRHQGAVL